jgi:uncharacterized lipoprotein
MCERNRVMRRIRLRILTALSMVAAHFLSGCASDPAPQQVASVQQVAAAPAGGQPASRPSDIQSLQQDRKQDAQVISDAQKALGAVGH